jgi:hypothetical protein
MKNKPDTNGEEVSRKIVKYWVPIIARTNPDSPCIGTLFFHAERYGTDLLSFALPIVRGRSAPVVHYVPHEFMGKDAFMRERHALSS